VGRYISEFQHSLQGIYTCTARIIYLVDYLKTYSSIDFYSNDSCLSLILSYDPKRVVGDILREVDFDLRY